MNDGIVGEVGKAAGTFMDALKREPLSLALVLMNLALLLFFYVLLIRVADQRRDEIALLYADKKDVRDLLAKCVVPQSGKGTQNKMTLPLPLLPEMPSVTMTTRIPQ